MAQITNPQAVRFVNEVVRPLAEAVRAIKVQIDAAMVAWFAGHNATFAASADTVEDGRAAEGVSRLTAGDVTALLVILSDVQAELNEAGRAAQVQKPCVRQLP